MLCSVPPSCLQIFFPLERSNQLSVFFVTSLEATHCFYIFHMAGNFVLTFGHSPDLQPGRHWSDIQWVISTSGSPPCLVHHLEPTVTIDLVHSSYDFESLGHVRLMPSLFKGEHSQFSELILVGVPFKPRYHRDSSSLYLFQNCLVPSLFGAGAFSYIDNLMSEASLHQGQDQKIKDMMNPTAQEIAVNLTKSHESRPFGLTAISFKPRIYIIHNKISQLY